MFLASGSGSATAGIIECGHLKDDSIPLEYCRGSIRISHSRNGDACGSTRGGIQKTDYPTCLLADVSSTDEALVITNTGDRPWDKIDASLLEGGAEGGGDNSFNYTNAKQVVQPGTALTVPWKKFVREDGLRYDPAKYAMQGISVDATNGGEPRGTFFTTQDMDRDGRGIYLNDCKPREPGNQK